MKRYIILLVLFSVAAWAGRPGDFKILGPGGGGAMFHPTVSPHDTREVLIACDMTGAYITHDGGQSWRMFSLRGVISFFAFDPLHPKTIYAGTRVLWRSTDDGETWSVVWPRPSSIRSIQMSNDHAEEYPIADDNPLGVFVTLAIDPADSNVMFAAGEKDKAFALYVSRKAGEGWEKLADLPEAPRKIWVDPLSNKNARDLYVADDHGVTVRQNGQWQRRPAPKGVTFNDISIGFSKPLGAIAYATSDAGVSLSRDGGKTWLPPHVLGEGAVVRAVATSVNHPEVAYVSYGHLLDLGKEWMGVARTSDAGGTWSLAWKEDGVKPAPNVHDTWLTNEFSPEWGENPLAMGVADQDPNAVWGTDFGRAMSSSDGGKSWLGPYSKRVPGAAWTSTGLDVTAGYGIIVDPFNADRRFTPYTDIGLIRTDDRGRSWTRSASGIPTRWQNTAYWITFDPEVRGRAWVAMSAVHDLPRPKMWRRQPVSGFKGGVCSSTDGGVTWKASNAGMPETSSTHILLDPSSPVSKRVLYVAGFGTGVFKSTDGGATWVQKNNGITQKEPFAWRFARAADGTLYVIIARRSEDGSIGNDKDGALYKSTDGAETWTPVTLPAGVNGPNGLQIDPSDPKRLYLAAWPRAAGMHGDGGGIFLSTDGGNTWTTLFDRDRHIYDVTIDPRDSNVLYAAGFESSVWRSTDKGEHWSRIPGFNFKWAYRVFPDPDDSKKIYVATFGGGLWHGAIDGEDKPVDIVTPVMMPGK